MAEYSQEDADEVFRHVYATLKAAIDFLIEMKVAAPKVPSGSQTWIME